jgi:hypothetical protein
MNAQEQVSLRPGSRACLAEEKVALHGMAVRHKVVLVEESVDDVPVNAGGCHVHHPLKLFHLQNGM